MKNLFYIILFFTNYIVLPQTGENLSKDELLLIIKKSDSLIKVEPNKAENYYYRGFYKNVLNEFSSALIDYNKAIILEPINYEYYFSRGKNYFGLNDFKKSIIDFTKCITIDSTSNKAYINRGFAYSMDNEFELAIDDYTKSLIIEPNSKIVLLNRGILKRNLNLNISALKDFESILKIYPTYSKAIEESAICKSKLNRKDAIFDFDKYINLNPKKGEGYYNRAIYCINYKIKKDYCLDLKKANELGFFYAKDALIEYCK